MGWVMAWKAGHKEAKIPRTSAARTPTMITVASGWIASVWPSLPMVKLCHRRNAAASPTPTTPPARPNIPPSLRTSQPMARPGKPSVRSTAFSFTRPRTTSHSAFATNPQPADRDDRADAEPAGEANEFDQLGGGFGEERFFRPGVGRFLAAAEKLVDGGGHGIELLGFSHSNIELGDHPKPGARGLLEERQFYVSDIVVLREGRAEDAGNRDGDAGGVEAITGFQTAALGEDLA